MSASSTSRWLEGFFAAEGLRIHEKRFGFGKPALDAVIRGEADLATVAETPLVFAILGGAKLRIAAVIGTSDRNAAIVARKSAGIAKPMDLEGKSIGVTVGTTGEYFLNCFLVSLGLGEKDVRIVDLKPEAMIGALAGGRVAAVATWNPTLSQVNAALAGDGLLLYGDDIYTENFCVAGDGEFIRKNPEVMKAFMRALIRAESYIRAYPEKAISACAAYDGLDAAGLAAVFGLFRFRPILDQSLLVMLEDESRWAAGRLAVGRSPPAGSPPRLRTSRTTSTTSTTTRCPRSLANA